MKINVKNNTIIIPIVDNLATFFKYFLVNIFDKYFIYISNKKNVNNIMFYVKILNLNKKIDNNDFLSKNDLYVNIHYGGIKKSTSIKKNGHYLFGMKILFFQ